MTLFSDSARVRHVACLLRLEVISVVTASNEKRSQDIRYFDPKRKELSVLATLASEGIDDKSKCQ